MKKGLAVIGGLTGLFITYEIVAGLSQSFARKKEEKMYEEQNKKFAKFQNKRFEDGVLKANPLPRIEKIPFLPNFTLIGMLTSNIEL